MRGNSHRVQFEHPESSGSRAITDCLNPQRAPAAPPGASRKTGLAFLELLYADGRLIRPREFEAGAVAENAHSVKIGTLARWQERRAKELLAANLTGRIPLADLAKACELSIRHFTRAFRGSTGMSPNRWLARLRIEKAKGLLTGSRRMLADIALDCGFADQSHFTRAFLRAVGLTPGAWQRLHRR